MTLWDPHSTEGVTWAQVGIAPQHSVPVSHTLELKSRACPPSWLGPGLLGPSYQLACPLNGVGPALAGIPVGLVTKLQWLEDRETAGYSVTQKECRAGWGCRAQNIL